MSLEPTDVSLRHGSRDPFFQRNPFQTSRRRFAFLRPMHTNAPSPRRRSTTFDSVPCRRLPLSLPIRHTPCPLYAFRVRKTWCVAETVSTHRVACVPATAFSRAPAAPSAVTVALLDLTTQPRRAPHHRVVVIFLCYSLLALRPSPFSPTRHRPRHRPRHHVQAGRTKPRRRRLCLAAKDRIQTDCLGQPSQTKQRRIATAIQARHTGH